MNTQAQERIEGRKLAEDAIHLVADSSDEFKQGFARRLRLYADSILGEVPTELRVMSKDEATKFEQTEISFGMFQDRRFSEVPTSYLVWIAEKSLDLQAYLRSEIGRKRISQDES